jgi:3-deoxy-D-manno-octulosonate 8-phosphate phosphatase (KDO 8-P phosphatase)
MRSPLDINIARTVRLLALDFDGVLTDGTVLFGSDGNISKSVSYHDIVGITRWRRLGRYVAIISGEDSPMLQHYASYYKIHRLYAPCKDKEVALWDAIRHFEIEPSQVVYMGDDVMDLCAMQLAGLSATVPTAHPTVFSQALWVSSRSSGRGAVRELVDFLLSAQGFDITDLGKRASQPEAPVP